MTGRDNTRNSLSRIPQWTLYVDIEEEIVYRFLRFHISVIEIYALSSHDRYQSLKYKKSYNGFHLETREFIYEPPNPSAKLFQYGAFQFCPHSIYF